MSINLKTAQSLTRHVKNASFQILLSNKRVVQGWILGLKELEMSDKRGLRLLTLLTYWDHQIGTTLPPHFNLVFEIELLTED